VDVTTWPTYQIAFAGNNGVGCAVKECSDKVLVACDYNYGPAEDIPPYLKPDEYEQCKASKELQQYYRCGIEDVEINSA
ncbi:unnamed protein product, partial [Strongylus vulgaris]